MKKLKTLFLLSLLMLFGLQAVSLLYPPAVFAATTGVWESRSLIKIGDVAYFDNKTDRDYTYKRQGDPDTCVDEIRDLKDGNKKGTLFIRTPSAANQKNCTEKKEPISLSSPEKSYIFFVWNNKTTIATSDQTNTYKLRDDGIFYEVGGDECKDSIYDFSSKTSAKLIARTNGDETSFTKNGNTAYRDGPNAIELKNPKRQDGCVVYDPVKIAITAEQNATGQPGTTNPVGDKLENDPQDDNSCESLAAPLGWILCPVILLLDNGLELIDTQIKNLLVVDANQFNNDGMRNASAAIRNLAYIIMIPIMLIMVIGTAIGSDFVSAYTVKKALPRLVVAVIFISLSFPLLTFAVSATNDIGSATLSFITYPFGNNVGGLSLADLYSAPTSGGGGYLTAIIHVFPKLIGAAVTALGLIAVLWFFGTTILLFAGVGFLVLMVRQMFIVLLILLAPLAILAWIFPGNDKLWKSWWGLFSKLLIMFPLIMALIASGRIFAWIINEGNSGSFTGDIVAPIGKLIAYMVPYAMIPLTFKFAGGIFSQIAGFVDNKEKGLFDRQRQSRAKKLERTASGHLFKNAPSGSGRARLNSLGFNAMNIRQAGLRPGSMRSNMAAFRGANTFAEATEAMQKNQALMNIMEDDNLLEAGRGGADAATVRQRLYAAGRRGDALTEGVSAVLKARSTMSNQAFDIASVMGTAATSTGFASGQGEMLAAIDQASGGNQVMYSKLLGAAKSQAARAGRLDLGGNSYGSSMELGETIRNAKTPAERQQAIKNANLAASIKVVEQQSAGAILSAKHGALTNLVPGLQARIETKAAKVREAHSTGDPLAISLAEREFKQTLADTAGLLDAAGQVSPENSNLLAEKVMNEAYVNEKGEKVRVSEAIKAMRGDAEFGQKRREYGDAALADYEARLRLPGPTPPPDAGPGHS